jgi:arylsulfatase A-like enzyme
MNRRQFMTLGAAAATATLLKGAPIPSPARKPNIVVIFTDDHGWADLGAHGAATDIKTPFVDELAKSGARCVSGYATAPQCIPSRAGLMSGRCQNRFGVEDNNQGPYPLDVATLPERLAKAGYRCGQVGKWHLNPNAGSKKWLGANGFASMKEVPWEKQIPFFPCQRGFHDYFTGEMRRYWANYALDGSSLPEARWVEDERYRIDVQTEAALAFVRRNREQPFFLYLAYYGPHTPFGTAPEYLARFPGAMPERRRQALGCIAAIDDGVGKISDELKKSGLAQDTLVFFISDNGAPLHGRRDAPLDKEPGGWDGSINDPWLGEKGMLSEGGIRVPFVVSWPGRIQSAVIRKPVSTLDVAATACALSGFPSDPALDGIDLTPALCGGSTAALERPLFWRWGTQAAVRLGPWKLLRLGGGRELLFDLESDAHERNDLAASQPGRCAELRNLLARWADGLTPGGLPAAKPSKQEKNWYEEHFSIKEEGADPG